MIDPSAHTAIGKAVRRIDECVDVIGARQRPGEGRNKESRRIGPCRNIVRRRGAAIAARKINDEMDAVGVGGLYNPFGAQGEV